MTKIYRVRRGWFNKCVVQEWCEPPEPPSGFWRDVDFRKAPPALTEAPTKQLPEKPE